VRIDVILRMTTSVGGTDPPAALPLVAKTRVPTHRPFDVHKSSASVATFAQALTHSFRVRSFTPAKIACAMRGPEWWVSGKEGSLAPWAQAKAWALMTVSKTKRLDLSDGDIAEQVTKVGGGHPTKQAIAQLRANIEADPSWHPGKVSESAEKRGPKAKLTEHNKKAIARSAMALKASGVEPSVAGVVAKCPALTLNPATQEAFTDKYILEVFRSHCFDPGSTVCWDHDNPLSKTALPDFLPFFEFVADRYGRGIHPPPPDLPPCS
jgi:hypothetical protein